MTVKDIKKARRLAQRTEATHQDIVARLQNRLGVMVAEQRKLIQENKNLRLALKNLRQNKMELEGVDD